MRIHDYLEYWADVARDRLSVEDSRRTWTYRERQPYWPAAARQVG